MRCVGVHELTVPPLATKRLAALAVFVALALVALAGCTNVRPSVAITPAPEADASPSASLPAATCDTTLPDHWKAFTTVGPSGTVIPVPVTLTCDRAVAAAWRAIGAPAGVSTASFAFGAWCDIEAGCPGLPPNYGHVVFQFIDGETVVVSVRSDDLGQVLVQDKTTIPRASPGS
jgi:hypothetical protein